MRPCSQLLLPARHITLQILKKYTSLNGHILRNVKSVEEIDIPPPEAGYREL